MRTALLSFFLAVATLPTAVAAAEPGEDFAYLSTAAIEHFADKGILEGSLDGSVHLARDITRAEFVRAITEYVYPDWAISETCLQQLDIDVWPGISYTHLFRDVSKDEEYALHLCAAMRGGMIWGYGDGNFRPDTTINLAEASKVMSVAFHLGYQMPQYQTDDWYANYLRTVRRYTELPTSATAPDHIMKIGETRQMLQNISERVASHHGSRVNGRLDTAIMSSVSVQHVSTTAAQSVVYVR